jgi:hypothetical protein
MSTHVSFLAALLALCVVLFALPAQAHKPIVIDGGPTDANTAYFVADVDVSQVAYHEAKPGQPEIWLTFNITAGTTLDLQLGVPLIDRYANLRPAMALLGPGLEEAELPFAVPEGYGAIVFSTEEEDPVVFNEEFTGTDSWQFPAKKVTVTEDGQYYLVAYIPSGEAGKLWVAIGLQEAFGIGDILSLPRVLTQVRAFHEIGPFGGILFWAMVILLVLGILLLALLFFFLV